MLATALEPQRPWVLPEPVLAPVVGADRFMPLTRRLDLFCGRWHKLRELAPERLKELRRVATIESVASSTRIEGADLSDEDVGRILAGLSLDSFRARDEQEVRGYHDLLELIFEQHATLPVTESSIKDFHRILLQHSEKDRHHRGRYKSGPNDVEARHPDGRREIVFRTAPPAETTWWMPRLIEEFKVAQDSDAWHPLVLIADFILWFLAIHPFEDGNGRLSRALTSLLLLKHDYAYIPYASLERVVEDNKRSYYAALRESQMDARQDARSYGSWLTFFLRSLEAQQSRLADFVEDAIHRASLAPAQVRILECIRQDGPRTSTWLAAELGLNQRTVRYHLNRLSRAGMLESTRPVAGRLYGLPAAARAVPAVTDSVTGATTAALEDEVRQRIHELARGLYGAVRLTQGERSEADAFEQTIFLAVTTPGGIRFTYDRSPVDPSRPDHEWQLSFAPLGAYTLLRNSRNAVERIAAEHERVIRIVADSRAAFEIRQRR